MSGFSIARVASDHTVLVDRMEIASGPPVSSILLGHGIAVPAARPIVAPSGSCQCDAGARGGKWESNRPQEHCEHPVFQTDVATDGHLFLQIERARR